MALSHQQRASPLANLKKRAKADSPPSAHKPLHALDTVDRLDRRNVRLEHLSAGGKHAWRVGELRDACFQCV